MGALLLLPFFFIMPTYEYACSSCREIRDVFKPMSQYDREESCEECGERMERRICTVPQFAMLDNPLPIGLKHHGTNVGEKVRSPAEQEKLYGKIIEKTRRQARKKARSSSRKKDNDMNMVAKIPRELWSAREQQYGKGYWEKEGDRALKRDGLKF